MPSMTASYCPVLASVRCTTLRSLSLHMNPILAMWWLLTLCNQNRSTYGAPILRSVDASYCD